MAEEPPKRNPFALNFRGNLIAGFLAIMPLIVVWLVFRFLLDVLFQAGDPLAAPLAETAERWMPSLKPILADSSVHWLIAVLLALFVLYAIGWVTSRVIGMRLMSLFERIITRIPLVETVYTAVRRLTAVLQRRPDGTAARVVLVEFPHPGARAVGLVMRTFHDAATGEELAAVLVPTSPNPSTGYLQILPVKALTPTDLTMDQAVTMIISGGATAPNALSLKKP
jgi:uncharacterized membrane protein